jgi:hypothetical protein
MVGQNPLSGAAEHAATVMTWPKREGPNAAVRFHIYLSRHAC